MKTKRSIMCLLLSLVLVLTFIPTTSFADDGTDHQHSRALQRIVSDENESDIPYCGEFYCKDCGETYYDTVTFEDLRMPVIDISGSLAGISKTKKVTVDISYMSEDLNFDSSATLKLQGGSSVNYPKKNYSVQFVNSEGKKNKVCLVDSWGKQSKYCLKANYVDYSQSRNVVSGRIFNEIVHSRSIDDEIGSLENGGVVDGYPVAVFLNDEFLGLYTMNIPKDNWMFGMKDETLRQALLFGDAWTDSVKLMIPIADVNNVVTSGWDMEYCSTEDDETTGTSWAAESMNEFIEFLNANDGEDFLAGVDQYTDVDRAIDTMIFTYFIHAKDNSSKNIIWATYDGVKWIPSPYDMDGSWGMIWDGSFAYPADDFVPSAASAGNVLFSRLCANYPEEIRARYLELRESVLSKRNIQKHFAQFIGKIPQVMYDAEKEKWTEVPSRDVNNYEQIINYMLARIDYLDGVYGVSVQDEELPCRITFRPESRAEVYVYDGQDYTQDPERTGLAFSRTGDGELTDADGQVDFLVIPDDGYVAGDVTVTPEEGYQSIEIREEKGRGTVYQITGISQDITVTVSPDRHKDHVLSGDIQYTWAEDHSSCKASGTCAVCEGPFGETVKSQFAVEKEASCTGEGAAVYTASFSCESFEDQTYEEIIPASGHKLIRTEAVDPDYDKEGTEEYWTCSECGKMFSDAEGSSEIAGPQIIPVLAKEVLRLGGATRYETSIKIADYYKDKLNGGAKFASAVIATGQNFPDALAGSYLANMNDAPIIMINESCASEVVSYIKENLVEEGTVYVLGGTGAVPDAWLGGLDHERLSGDDRYGTNLEILKNAGVSGGDMLICTGTEYADALSGSGLDMPIMLVRNELTDDQRSFLSKGQWQLYIAGGTGAVNSNIEEQLRRYDLDGKTDRFAGDTRYETSEKLAAAFAGDADRIVLATGKAFPDGLCGGPLAYKLKAPILLTAPGNMNAGDYAVSRNIRNGIVLGGTGAVDDKTAADIFSIDAGHSIEVY